MRRTALAGTILFVALLVTVSALAQQLQRQPDRAKMDFVRPHITLVSQNLYPSTNNLVLTGTGFPAKSAGGVTRAIRLTPSDGDGDALVEPGNAGWTPSRIETTLSFNVVAGKRYRVGLVQYESSNPGEKSLISNEVEYLILMNLDTITPNPVPQGVQTIEVNTSNDLGKKAGKIVKVGNQEAEVLRWGGSAPNGAKFMIRLPGGLVVPGVHDLYVEENGTAVSKHLQVRILGILKR